MWLAAGIQDLGSIRGAGTLVTPTLKLQHPFVPPNDAYHKDKSTQDIYSQPESFVGGCGRKALRLSYSL